MLRRRERERHITALRQRLRETPGTTDCSVWLFGSLAGGWDGYSDTDLLVVGATREVAERVAERLDQACPGAWWRQARNDLELADVASRNGFHAQACFFASPAAEKALKGAIVELGLEPPHTHTLPWGDRRASLQRNGSQRCPQA